MDWVNKVEKSLSMFHNQESERKEEETIEEERQTSEFVCTLGASRKS